MRALAFSILVAAAACRPMSDTPVPTGGPAPANPRIVILKSQRRLILYDGAAEVRSYKVALGGKPVGDKEREGDRRTPEGTFRVCTRNQRSRFHLFLGLSYPAADDAARGLAQRLIDASQHDAIVAADRDRRCPPWNTPLGGEVGIHGHGADRDWTLGCIALANSDIEELWRACPKGTEVEVRP